MVKWLLQELNTSLKEYIDTGKFTIAEGYKKDHSDDWVGGFYSLVIFILLMIVIFPLCIILDIILIITKIPLCIFGIFIIWIYKKLTKEVGDV